MKRYIFSLLLLLLIFTVSCAPKNTDSAKDRMTNKGYNVEVYTTEKQTQAYNDLYDIEGCKAVITAFKNSGTTFTDYCNIILFDTTSHAKEALQRIKDVSNKSEIKDDTVYDIKRSGKWIYYGSEQGMKDFINQ